MPSFKTPAALLAAIAVGAFAGVTAGDTVSTSGTIDGTEPTFDQPLSGAAVQTSYDTFKITVDTDGVYAFYSFYPGDTSVDANMDGTLFAYDTTFNPLAPNDNLVGSDDDYTAGGIAQLAGIDTGAVGQNASGFEAALTAGTSYIIVQSTFTDAPTSFGQPTGPYDLTITGPGNISFVPAPAVGVALMAGLAGISRRRRRHLIRTRDS